MRARLGMVVLVLLVAANVVLIPLAIRHARPEQASKTPAPRASTASPSATPSVRRPVPKLHGPLIMLAAGRTVVAASHGSCTGPAAVVEVSRDGGESFSRVRVAPRLRQVLGLDVDTDGALELAGTVGPCRPAAFRSRDGRSWKSRPKPAIWRLPSKPARQVVSPTGPLPLPCVPLGLSTLGGGLVRVLCNTGQVQGPAANATWVELGRLARARAVRYVAPGRGYAIAPTGRCRSEVFLTDDGGSTWTPRRCVGSSTAAGIAGVGGNLIARAGDSVLVSNDGGATWSRPSGG